MDEAKRHEAIGLAARMIERMHEMSQSAHALDTLLNKEFVNDIHADEGRRIEREGMERYRKKVRRLLRCINLLAVSFSRTLGAVDKKDLLCIADLTHQAYDAEAIIRADPRLAHIWGEDEDMI